MRYRHAKWRLSAGGWNMPGIFAQCLIPQGQCKEKKIDIKDKADHKRDESSRYLVRYCEKLGPGLKRGCRGIVARGPVCLFKISRLSLILVHLCNWAINCHEIQEFRHIYYSSAGRSVKEKLCPSS